jgi:quercetin dioxygenase-like cupin family protein
MSDITPPSAAARPNRDRASMKSRRGLAVAGAILLLSGPMAYVALGSGSSAVGDASEPVSSQVLVQAALPGAAHVNTKGPSDVEVFRLTIKPAASTAWHSHAGSVLVSVSQGTAAVYSADAGGCTRHRYEAGDALLEHQGEVHTIRNEGSRKLVLYAASILPKGSDPGVSETAPANCVFTPRDRPAD